MVQLNPNILSFLKKNSVKLVAVALVGTALLGSLSACEKKEKDLGYTDEVGLNISMIAERKGYGLPIEENKDQIVQMATEGYQPVTRYGSYITVPENMKAFDSEGNPFCYIGPNWMFTEQSVQFKRGSEPQEATLVPVYQGYREVERTAPVYQVVDGETVKVEERSITQNVYSKRYENIDDIPADFPYFSGVHYGYKVGDRIISMYSSDLVLIEDYPEEFDRIMGEEPRTSYMRHYSTKEGDYWRPMQESLECTPDMVNVEKLQTMKVTEGGEIVYSPRVDSKEELDTENYPYFSATSSRIMVQYSYEEYLAEKENEKPKSR